MSGIIETEFMVIIPEFTVQMDIIDVLYLSYLIPERRLRTVVPEHIQFSLKHEDKTIISLVIFRSRNVSSSFFPFLRFSYNQANIRTYVVDPVNGKPAVFFLKSSITSPFISLVTKLFKIPWQSISINLDVFWENDISCKYNVRGNWEGDFHISLNNDNKQPNHFPFKNIEETIRFLTSPATGFYGKSGKLVRFEVSHSPIKPLTGRLLSIEYPILNKTGFLTDEELEEPQSILIAPYGHFTVFMPPEILSMQNRRI